MSLLQGSLPPACASSAFHTNSAAHQLARPRIYRPSPLPKLKAGQIQPGAPFWLFFPGKPQIHSRPLTCPMALVSNARSGQRLPRSHQGKHELIRSWPLESDTQKLTEQSGKLAVPTQSPCLFRVIVSCQQVGVWEASPRVQGGKSFYSSAKA